MVGLAGARRTRADGFCRSNGWIETVIIRKIPGTKGKADESSRRGHQIHGGSITPPANPPAERFRAGC